MAFFKRMLLIASVLAVGAYAAPQGNNNEYLPPADTGYNYPKPSVPFVSSPPATVYRPPVQSSPAPRPQTPSYPRPPTPSYNPPPPPSQNTYIPPPQANPTYRPPQPTYTPRPQQYVPPVAPPYQPPQTNYGPPKPVAPAYRPPQQTPPAYKPPQQSPPAYKPPQPTYGPPQTTRPSTPFQQDNGQDASNGHDHNHGADHVHEAGMPYDFNYAVKDDYYGTDFSQNEVSDGDNVKGEYRVQLPDGRLQIVRYTADWKTGFHAEVTYEGEAKFPEQAPYKPQQQQQQQQQPNYSGQSSNQQGGSAGYNYPAPSQKPSSSYGAPTTGY